MLLELKKKKNQEIIYFRENTNYMDKILLGKKMQRTPVLPAAKTDYLYCGCDWDIRICSFFSYIEGTWNNPEMEFNSLTKHMQ